MLDALGPEWALGLRQSLVALFAIKSVQHSLVHLQTNGQMAGVPCGAPIPNLLPRVQCSPRRLPVKPMPSLHGSNCTNASIAGTVINASAARP